MAKCFEYENLVRFVLDNGEIRHDRTGVGTISVFGAQTRYDLRNGFPLVTTKKVNFSAVVKELLWFLRGETNIKTLGCGIWDEWADDNGDLGPIYGHQWRQYSGHFGIIDQIGNAVEMLKHNPESRRNIVSAWTVCDIHLMALPPCHTMFQLNVSGVYVDLQLYQRSADLALGVPFNIASYALLLTMMASATRLVPRYFIHTIGDAHVYRNHVDGLGLQLSREPRDMPLVHVEKTPDFGDRSINLTPDDIRLEGYDPHPAIKFKVAV